MIAAGQPGSSHIQAILLGSYTQRRQNLGVACESKIIASGKIRELSTAKAHIRAVDLLKWFGFLHSWFCSAAKALFMRCARERCAEVPHKKFWKPQSPALTVH